MDKELRRAVGGIFRACNQNLKAAILAIQACKEEFPLRHEHIHCAVLHRAAESGNLPIAQLLLDEGAKVDVRDAHQNTPLMKAAKFGHLNMTELFIAHGANVAALNNSNESAMRLISLREPNPAYPRIGQLLLSAGACPIFNAKPDGQSCFEIALNNECLELALVMIPYLKAHVQGQKYLQEGLRLMSLYNETNAIIELVLNGVDHSWDDPSHGSALTVALKHKRGHSALALVAAGARKDDSDATEITFDLDVKVMFTRLQAAVALGNAAFLKRAMDEDAEPSSLLERSLQSIRWAENNYMTPGLQISKSMVHRLVAFAAINETHVQVPVHPNKANIN